MPVVEELSSEDLLHVAEVAVPRSEFHKVVVREGDDSATCYVVRSGHARATPGHRDGRVLTLATSSRATSPGARKTITKHLRNTQRHGRPKTRWMPAGRPGGAPA
jgi:hypothetical protein